MFFSNKAVETENCFGHYLSLENSLKTVYFLTKNTSTDDFSDFSIQNHRNARCFLEKLSKTRQYLKTYLGSFKDKFFFVLFTVLCEKF